ncbi:MAG: hypothetical protein K6E29_02940 [Cyanobacteria bacterium RUI128]|nr:hypothetical protein [Cyanobacteria bacterium RUI128]
MYISGIQSTNNRTGFTGLNKNIGHRIFIDGKKNALELLSTRGDKNTRVGELPPAIFDRLPLDNREGRIKEILTMFEDCANELRGYKPGLNAPVEERTNRRPNSIVQRMRETLTKHGVLDEPEKFDLKYLGGGEYKKAFLMEGVQDPANGDRFCYKVFHMVDTTPEWHKYKCHGNYSEINIATYWKKQVGNNTQLNKFYCGDINNGYLIDRYVDSTTPRPKKIIDPYDYGVRNIDIVNCDVGHNRLYGFSIDEGGSRVVNRVKNQSKTARYVLKKIKAAPENFRFQEWSKMLHRKGLDDTQKKAGLALSLKHFPAEEQKLLIGKCLSFNKPLVDQAIGYALKYLPEEDALALFETLMKRKNPTTQTVLMNEIPLLSMKDGKRFDDVNVPKAVVNPKIVEKYYDVAKRTVLPEVEEHLASYVHLLPKERIVTEAKELSSRNNYHINDRLLHKIRFVPTEEYSFGDKMEVIADIKSKESDPFILKKAEDTRIRVIRDSLSEE